MHTYRLTPGEETFEVLFHSTVYGLANPDAQYTWIVKAGLTEPNARQLVSYLNGGEGLSNAVSAL